MDLIFGLTEIARAESFDDENVVQIVAVLKSRLARERLETCYLLTFLGLLCRLL